MNGKHLLSVFIFLFTFLALSKASVFAQTAGTTGYGPDQVKAAYNLPSSGGSGTIAIVDQGTDSTLDSDLTTFDSQYNLPDCSESNGCLTVYNMGGTPVPANPSTDIVETSLDVEWAHAIAPNAKILLVLAQSMQPNDLANAIAYAGSQPGVVAVSLSFGGPEGQIGCDSSIFPNADNSVAYFAASGDWGQGVSWPSDCSQVIAVGGTSLNMNGNTFVSETAWSLAQTSSGTSGTGGGPSQVISEPSYQSTFGIPQANNMRGVPDVAAIADPKTGVTIVVQGSTYRIGGTSLATPVWAGIAALNGQVITHNTLYGNAASSTYSQYYRDITQGSNGSCGFYCTATTGYDYLTGLGTPINLPGQSPGPTPTGTPTTTPTGQPTPIITGVTRQSTSQTGIDGVVFTDVNNNGTYDSGSDQGIGGAVAKLSGAASKQTTSTATVSQQVVGGTTYYSNFSFQNLNPGTYTLTVTVNNNSYNLNNIALKQNQTDFATIAIPQTQNPTPIPTQTPTNTPNNGNGSGNGNGSSGSSGGSGNSLTGTPTPTPIPYTCHPDPNCVQSAKNINLCQLLCTPL